MASIIAMCCYDTKENDRTKYTKETLWSLIDTVDFKKHKLHITDNASCKATKELLNDFRRLFESLFPMDNILIITLKKNYGTAVGINFGIKWRDDFNDICGVIKIDNDIVVHGRDWVDELEEIVMREPKIGLASLKRNDFSETSNHPEEQWRTKLFSLEHTVGQKHFILEQTNGAMSNCQMMSAKLLDNLGYLYQKNVYGWDDKLMAVRANKAGFGSVFLPYPRISHIDNGANSYTQEKIQIATQTMKETDDMAKAYLSGEIPFYYEQDFTIIETE